MKKIFYLLVIGLASLLALSSCEDSFIYNDEEEFVPVGYIAKSPETEDEDAVSTTLQIMGLRGLVFDEIEKSDWRIITQDKAVFKGNHPLVIEDGTFEIETTGDVFEAETNYEEAIPFALANTKVMYTYLGNQVQLEPLEGGITLSVKIEEEKLVEEPIFIQYGYIVYTLRVGYIPVKIHKHPFLVVDSDAADDYFDDDSNETNN